MIKMFEHDATVFTSQGLGDITKIITQAESEEALNGVYAAEFNVVYDKWGKWRNVTKGRIIYADGQPFRIYATRKNLRGFTAYARHVFWDLLDNEVRDIRPTDKNAMAAGQDILGATNFAHPFTFFSDITTLNTQYYINRNPVDCLIGNDSLRTRWGGELKLDNWLISILGQRGQDNGVQITYRKNMQDVDVEESYDGFITRLRPKGNNGLELPEVYIDSPYIGNYPHPVIREVSFDITLEDYATQAEAEAALRAASNAYYTSSKCDIPAGSIEVDLVLLENTTEYAAFRNLVTVSLGDMVTCRHLDLEIDHTARVVKITKDLLTGKNAKVEIGMLKKRVSNSFTRIKNTLTDISTVVETNKTSLQLAIDEATALLTSALGGYVIKRNGEILIMDTEDPTTATQVWRWNLNGLGYNSSEMPGAAINGPYGIAMTMDGKINASFITTGELDAAIIKTGSIQADKLSISAQQVLIEAVKVGGRNLLTNGGFENGFAEWSKNTGTENMYDGSSNTTWEGKNILLTAPPGGASRGIYRQYTGFKIGTEYTFSAYMYVEDRLWFGANTGTSTVVEVGGWKRVTNTFVATATTQTLYIIFYNSAETAAVYVDNVQLEEGNKATAWSPAPEEKVGTNEIVSKINVTPEAIKIQASKISLEGLVTVNNNFKVLADGSIEGVNAKLSGSISATKMVSPSSNNYYAEIGSAGGYIGLALYDIGKQSEAFFEVIEGSTGGFIIRDKNNVTRIMSDDNGLYFYDQNGVKQMTIANNNAVASNDFSALRAIRSGTVTLNKDTSTAVSFPAMQGTPSIVLTPYSSYSGVVVTAKITAVSSTGFSAIIQGTPVSSATFHWIAVAPDTSA